MKVVVPNKEKYYIDAQVFMLQNTIPWVKKHNINFFRFMLIFSLIFGSLMSYAYYQNRQISNLIFAIIFFSFTPLFSIYLRWVYIRTFKKYFLMLKDDGDITIELDREYLKFSIPKISSTMQTKDIIRFYESESYFYILVRKIAILYIPKEVIDNVNTFRSEILEYSKANNLQFETTK